MDNNLIQNESGFSSIEAVILMIVFTLMVSFTLGTFGIIHTGILHSISARNYAFETFRHRATLTYLRDAPQDGKFSGSPPQYYSFSNYRLHGVVSETAPSGSVKYPSERPITKAKESDEKGRSIAAHDAVAGNGDLKSPGQRYGAHDEDGVNPVWIKVSYGICLNAVCQ
jgi:flagellin-like protein